MEVVFQGLVIPKVVYIGEIVDINEDGALPYTKRFEFFVWLGDKVIKFDEDEKYKLCTVRQEIIDKVNEYYSELALLSRPRSEGEF